MSRRMTSLAAASLAAASFVVSGSALANGKAVVDEALWLINNIPVQNNTWDLPCAINWETPTAKTKAACFFTLSLMRAMGYAKTDVYRLWESTSPASEDYYALLKASPALDDAPPRIETFFRRVTRVEDIEKGDILVIGKTMSGNTVTYAGHTVMITGAPIEILPQIEPRYADTRQFALPIADSTNSAHGCNSNEFTDSRWNGNCKSGYHNPGVGTGYMRIYTHTLNGDLLGYTWSVTSSKDSYMSPKTRPYLIGRLYKLPPPAKDDLPPPPP